ncbi:hypothetical protein C3F09_07680, partial [candidate division GN15 bacterium]
HQHDVHDADAADQERNGGDRAQQIREHATHLRCGVGDILLRAHLEVVVLVLAESVSLAQQRSDLAVYRDLKRRVDIPIRNVAGKKPFQVEVSISTDGRTDISQTDMIQGNKIEYSVAVE